MIRASWVLVVLSISFTFHPGSAAGADRTPIVAVFDMEATRVKITRQELRDLSDHLATLLTSTGRYQVVPRSELRARLQQQKVESYKECVDQSCQVELGRELAAEKTLSSKVVRLGKKCTIHLNLFDLRKAAAEKGASERGACDVDSIVVSLEKAAAKLVGSAPASPSAQPAGTGRARVMANIKGARVSVDGEAKGFTPLTVSGLLPGQHLARVEAQGLPAWQQTFVINAGQQTMVVAELKAKKKKRSFKDRFKAGLGDAVEIGADVVGVTVDTAKEVHHNATADDPAEAAAPAPFEILQPDGKATWLRCPVGQTWEGSTCTGQPQKLPFYKARSACPSGFKLPLADDLINLLGGCDENVTAGQDGHCAACQAGQCAQVFGDDQARYWTFSTDLSTGRVRTVGLNGQVEAVKPDAELQVRCIRR